MYLLNHQRLTPATTGRAAIKRAIRVRLSKVRALEKGEAKRPQIELGQYRYEKGVGRLIRENYPSA